MAILGAAAPNGSKAVGALENIPSSLNVDVLKRNTYVILGLSAGIIAMVAVLSFFASSRTKGYNVVAAGAPYQDDKQYQY